MKRFLTVFLILSLFSGCQKRDIVLICHDEEMFATTVFMYTFTGDYKKITANSLTINITLTTVGEAKKFAESQQKNNPNDEISINGKKVTIFSTDERLNRNSSKEEYNYFISMLESDGFICVSEKQ